MSGIAGGEAGKPEQVAKVAEFTHLTEPDGTVYPAFARRRIDRIGVGVGTWRG